MSNRNSRSAPFERVSLAHALADYRDRWPSEAAVVDTFEVLAREHASGRACAYSREPRNGHFTASSWLVDRSGTRALLTHHRKLDRWLQLGGHADGDADLRAVALKEAQEESGLPGLIVDETIFDLDRHWIPEHKDVPAHWHYDVRYVVRTTEEETYSVSDESHALAWQDIGQIAADPNMDASLRRTARKWRERA